jgi:hypothetical protein
MHRYSDEQITGKVAQRVEQALKQVNDSTLSTVVINTNTTEDSISDSDIEYVQEDGKPTTVNINLVERTLKNSGILVPLVCGSIMFIGAFATPILIAFFICLYIYRTKRSRNEVIKASIESGRELPAEFFARRSTGSRLQSGFCYIAWGVGIFAFFIGFAEYIAWIGVIPFIIGIGKLVAYYIYDYKNIGNTSESNDNDK